MKWSQYETYGIYNLEQVYEPKLEPVASNG